MESAEPVPEVGPEEDADDEPVPPLVVLLGLLDPVLQFRRLRRV